MNTVSAFSDITSIPGALQSLYNLYSAAYPMDANNIPSMIWFGEELSVFSAPTTIEINSILNAEQEPAEIAPTYKKEETYDVRCKLSVFNGSGSNGSADFLANMLTCWDVWKALEIAVANNPTLDGNVRYCFFTEMAFEPTTDGAGRAAGYITWVVRCVQRVTSLS